VARSNAGLHPLVLDRVAQVVRALDLVGGADEAIVGLSALSRLKEVTKNLVIDLHVGELSGWIGPWIHTRSPPKILTLILYLRADLNAYLWEANQLPVVAFPICRILKSIPSINMMQALPMSLSLSFWKSSCGGEERLGRHGRRGG
jgi:hypothetical protein